MKIPGSFLNNQAIREKMGWICSILDTRIRQFKIWLLKMENTVTIHSTFGLVLILKFFFSVLSDEKYMILSESNENVIFLHHIQKETKYT